MNRGAAANVAVRAPRGRLSTGVRQPTDSGWERKTIAKLCTAPAAPLWVELIWGAALDALDGLRERTFSHDPEVMCLYSPYLTSHMFPDDQQQQVIALYRA